MIRAVKAINYLGRSLLMRLDGREDDSLLLWNVDGISPGSADINVTEVASTDGAYFNSARQNSREITLTLLLNWAPNIESARKDSYAYFPLKKPVRLIFYSDTDMDHGKYFSNCARYIDGYVQQNTVEIFGTKNCAAQIVIKCPDPYFYEYNTDTTVEQTSYVKHAFGEQIAGFEFPFSNESLSDDLIEFASNYIGTDECQCYYPTDGTETGFDLIIRFLKNFSETEIQAYNSFKITHLETGKSFTLNLAAIINYPDYASGYLKGDALVVSTVRGNRDVTISRKSIDNGEGVSVLRIFTDTNYRENEWIQLIPGVNTFKLTTGIGDDPVGKGLMTMEISYIRAYEGV